MWWAYLVAVGIGAFIGIGEILSRYKDAPWAAVRSGPGLAYIAFNGLTAALAMLFLDRIMPLWAEQPSEAPMAGDLLKSNISNALIAGFGSMAVLRSSILTARVGGKDVEVGPAAVIEILRGTMDRGIARIRAKIRADNVLKIMGNISFVRSYSPLASISLSLLQSVDADERAMIEQQIGALANQTGRTDRDKALELGLILAGSVGFDALDASVGTIRNSIENNAERPVFVARQMTRLSMREALRDLPPICLALNPDVSREIQRSLSEQVDAIDKSDLSDTAKSINAGLVIASALGEESLKAGIDLLTSGLAGDPGI